MPDPEPGPAEVRVRVQACGICLSDVHLIDGTLPAPLDRVTPGHEPAGVIEQVGEGVPEHWAPGKRVLMAAGKPCGECRNCIRGYPPSSCLAPLVMGFAFAGAWAEHVVVPWQALTAVPDHVPIEQAAILADAVSTVWGAYIRSRCKSMGFGCRPSLRTRHARCVCESEFPRPTGLPHWRGNRGAPAATLRALGTEFARPYAGHPSFRRRSGGLSFRTS